MTPIIITALIIYIIGVVALFCIAMLPATTPEPLWRVLLWPIAWLIK